MPTPSRRIPVSSYRLQCHQSFTFQDAANIVPYLHDLGITDCYVSPYLKALPGSTHGYDVIDPTSLNPELGNDADYQAFFQALDHHQMGQILDVVPNHLGIDRSANPWWQDVLENGPSSRYAKFFDIDWNPVKPELENKVLLPILGEQYGIALENQEITLVYADGSFALHYYDHHLPTDPSSWPLILSLRQEELAHTLSPEAPHYQEYQSILTALSHLPSRNERDPERIAERYREKDVIQRRLAALCQEQPEIETFFRENVRILNGVKGSYSSFDLLDALVSDQAYRLAYWRVAAEEINYRRFFDINELAAIRMEQDDVFTEIHQRVFALLRSGAVTGLRIDHIDGLYDPSQYLQQWQAWAHDHLQLPADRQGRSIYIVVEKILGKSETLCKNWACDGTTGYEFLTLVNNLFVDSRSLQKFDDLYRRFTKSAESYEDLIYQAKKLIMSSAMSSEINALGHQLSLLSERNRRSRDFTLNSLIHAVREIIACFPVYRTYITYDPSQAVADRDQLYIRVATIRAKRRNPAISSLVFDFIQDLLLKIPITESRLDWREVNSFIMKFQQTTSPVMAKGVEDTAFYIYSRFLSLNEVGGEPDQFGIPLPQFHEKMQARYKSTPHSLSTTSTHDTKRGEDVRARLNVISELPQEWRKRVSRWYQLNKKAKQTIDDQTIPARQEEYFLYQTLLGCWPFGPVEGNTLESFSTRIQDYMIKALREAKVHSSWLNPNEAYEHAMREFIARILTPARSRAFFKDFLPFQEKIAHYGIVNSLSQVLVKVTAPGIPDFYQGTERWDLNLVDPDNRRPVDYDSSREALARLRDAQRQNGPIALLQELLEHPENGEIKLWTTLAALHYRREHAALFADGHFQPLDAEGPRSQHICAFARIKDNQVAITLIPRFIASLGLEPTTWPMEQTIWEDTYLRLPHEWGNLCFRNLFTDEIVGSTQEEEKGIVFIANILQNFPVALLARTP
ncbi:MAG: malto-oligosyltrehalose synthase [Nitrospirales bacterium]|nr:malto-oligosyltrehalose synthase [Nitrospira sp.]MDR4499900.1 malto-oligosyltrehalose synthase [Nitrospirales bacterium]